MSYVTEVDETANWLFDEGGNPDHDDANAQVKTEAFDVVVLATPMTRDKRTLELRNISTSPLFPGR